MGVSSSNRGGRVLARHADSDMAGPNARADRQAHKDEAEKLREQVSRLERDLSRARRCLAAERLGRERTREQLSSSERAYGFAVSTLCRAAFGGHQEGDQ